jgi:ribulose-phosphate 3-epimerase
MLISKNKKIFLEVDGGVNSQNISDLTNAGANLIVAGNSIFKGGAESYAKNINALKAPLTKK